MTAAARPAPAACPGCAASPTQDASAGVGANADALWLSVPGVHCAGCIATVERTLEALPEVRSARVNLSRKQVSVAPAAPLTAATLVSALEAAGYEAHELDTTRLEADTDPAGRALLMRLGVAGFAMMNVMLLSVAVWSGAADSTRDLFHWISALIAVPAVAFSAQPFFLNAWGALQHMRLNMDVPISLAILLATGMSVFETAMSGEHAFFDAALSLTFFLLAGRYLDHRSRSAARSAAAELSALEVPRATRLTGAGPQEVPLADLAPGDRILVRPGARVPADGRVDSGTSEIDRSLLTGETAPQAAAPGTDVTAGEINLTGPLTVTVRSHGQDTTLRRLADLVAVAEGARNRYTSLADKAARIYAPVVHLLAGFAFLGWYLATGDLRLSINIAVATLIITCPCALGLAVPAVSVSAAGALFRKGLLIKNATTLERLAGCDTVVFDKTGTLTLGRPRLLPPTGLDATSLGIAAALAAGSDHPLAAAIDAWARDAGIAPAEVENRREVPGFGVEGTWSGLPVRLGRGEWTGAGPTSGTVTCLAVPGHPVEVLEFVDQLRPGAREVVTRLKAAGKAVHLLSGDTESAVRAIADELGIEHISAGALPEDKIAYVRDLARSGRTVAMIGDGLNDTAALAEAHVSISPASALDAARTVSDAVLLGADLAPVADALVTARKAVSRIRENFGLAALYNAVAIPIALSGFATPLAAALAMSTSSILVSLNALRVRA